MVAFLLLIFFTVGTVTLLMFGQTSWILRDNARDNQHRLVRQTITNINNSVQSIENSYLYFALNSSVFTGIQKFQQSADYGDYSDYEDVRRLKEMMFSFVSHIEGLDTVIFISPEGRTISNLGGLIAPEFFRADNNVRQSLFEGLAADPSRTIWYLDDIRESGEIYYMRSLFDPDSGESLGILAFIIDESLFAGKIADLVIPGGGVAIADSNGIPFIHTHAREDLLPAPVPAQVVSGREPVTVENRKSFRIIYPSENHWFVISEIPKAIMYRDMYKVVSLGLFASILCILFSALLGFLISRSYTRDFSALISAMGVSARGQLESLSSHGSTEEFRSLAFSYNEMIRNLDQLTGDLKHEIDEKTRAETEIRDLNENLERKVQDRTAQLQDSLETLRLTQSHLIESEKMASLGSLVAGLAHEINTPVGISVTGTSFLADKTEDALTALRRDGKVDKTEYKDFLELTGSLAESLLTNMRRVSGLISSFKQVSVDQTHETHRTFLIGEYFNAIVDSLRHALGSMTVEVECPSDLSIDSYPGVYGQILTNLLMNARIHAYPEDRSGQVVIKVSTGEVSIVVEVADSGVGMNSEIRKKIYEPFFTTNRSKGGTGLGMHIVYNLVTQKLGGRIKCLSSLENGSRFIMILPLHFSGDSAEDLVT